VVKDNKPSDLGWLDNPNTHENRQTIEKTMYLSPYNQTSLLSHPHMTTGDYNQQRNRHGAA
jgi:hypothetical protein